MTVHNRKYVHKDDYNRIGDFLIENYQAGNADGNWIEPIWEYMHFHSALNPSILSEFGVWESDGKIVASAHSEWRFGEAFFQFHPQYRHLRAEMLDYAETNLCDQLPENGDKTLSVYVNDNDPEFLHLVKARGYQRDNQNDRPLSRFDIPETFPAIEVPPGFRVTSLEEDCDWAKVNRVLWRGFNHPGDPPDTVEDLESRQRMFDTPKAKRNLKIAVVAPDGNFVSFCGMFYEPTNRYCLVEPVATDPDYRRMGLGKAAVLEGIRRCKELGALTAYVGSDQLFYLAIGFKVIYNSECWKKNY